MSWHYAVGGQQKGPVSDEEFSRLVKEGTVRADTLVWKEGWAEWRAYGAVAGGAANTVAVDDATTAVCAVSGRRLPKSEMLEFEGRWVSAEHKDEFFQRLREGVSLPSDVVYGGFWRRFFAKFIDGIIIWTIFMTMAFGMGMLMAGMGAGGGSDNVRLFMALQVLLQILIIVMMLAYVIFFTRKYDATPGKMALGLKVFRPDGSKLSKGRIVGRYFAEGLSSFMAIGYLMVAFDKDERRSLHDRIADTRVIKVRGN